MRRRAAASLGAFLTLCVLASVARVAGAWPLSFGNVSANRVAAGRGTFPRWQAFGIATAVPMRWVVVLGSERLAAVDRDGTLWILGATRGGLGVATRYGEAVSPDASPAVVSVDEDHRGLALVGKDGRLLLWSDGALRSYDVGAPLSRLSFPLPVRLPGQRWDDLLAVAADGAVVLIASLPSVPRIVSRVEARALADARITLGDLDGDGLPDAVVLSDPTDRFGHGILGDRVEAAGVTVIGVTPFGLSLRGRHTVAGAAYEDLVPVLAPISEGGRPAVLLARSAGEPGTVVAALVWRDGSLVPLAESPAPSPGNDWVHVIGTANLGGDGAPEVVAVRLPHSGGVLIALRRRGAALAVVAQAPGFGSHAAGSRNQDQALVADFDGNGRPEVVLPRQSRVALAALELDGSRWVERWSVTLRGPIESNLAAADVDGDGLLDLVFADRHTLYVFFSLSVR
ncbi:MAG TPA: VCBS repeat-containing protein [Methylomirabilota bacterium]|nr:VCBS repeat-containing protein [Methylomirabilota bacterium]